MAVHLAAASGWSQTQLRRKKRGDPDAAGLRPRGSSRGGRLLRAGLSLERVGHTLGEIAVCRPKRQRVVTVLCPSDRSVRPRLWGEPPVPLIVPSGSEPETATTRRRHPAASTLRRPH
jgi:hypothetical protein